METPPPPQPGYANYPRTPQNHNVGFDLGLIGEAWNIIKSDFGTFVPAGLVLVVLTIIAQIPGYIYQFARMGTLGGSPDAIPPLDAIIIPNLWGVAASSVVAAFAAGISRMVLLRLRGEPAELGKMFDFQGQLGSLIVCAVLMSIASFIGFCLCVLPGLLVGGALMMAPLLVIDRKMAPVEAIKASWQMSVPNIVMAGVLYLCTTICSALGIFLCGIGILLTYPILYVVAALLYRNHFPEHAPAG